MIANCDICNKQACPCVKIPTRTRITELFICATCVRSIDRELNMQQQEGTLDAQNN